MCAEGKLKDAEKQEEKQKQSAAKKLERLIEKVNRLMSYFHFVQVCTHTTDYLSPNCLLMLHSDRAKFKKST